MERNIQNIDSVEHVTDIGKVNNMLSNGWIIITTLKRTYHEDVDYDEITYCLGHLIEEEPIEENFPPD